MENHAVLCVKNGKLLSRLHTSYNGALQLHPHMFVCAQTLLCMNAYPETHTPSHMQQTHKAGIRECPSETILWKLFLCRKKGMKANGDLASNSRVGYPG